MGDPDLRLVRHFTVVAEHAHVGRAAEALHLAQPALSRQIRRLEAELGVVLLERHRHGVRLTAAGRVYLDRARVLLELASTAQAEARAAAAPERLVVGHVAALRVTPAVRALRLERPDADVRTCHLAWNEPRAALLGGRVDAAVFRMPVPAEGLEIHHLGDEPRVLLVAADHRLAARASVRLADLADEPMPQLPDPDPEWAAFWRVDPRPDGRPAPAGPAVATPEDRLEAVAEGRAVALATAAVLDGHLRSDLVAVPVEDLGPVAVVLGVRAGDRRPLLETFVRIARDRPVSP
ncbi:LysR substrate-binding domain-containing protein [Actinomycetospora sp. NBRC 106378]|uniref:LysR substrate-binding domain-containing protein n=1 Tax=Actinomycetospora sp. NBRC 106378 TaxID=3032208 RepID=UPI0024A4BC23|nr:LysR substrate-binding domain-containing protein [Actinomycetospora sp. NBRC 106378]GLZ53549.1 LysR family transcriptional regulator [Actinomycetospora sp. NBRC 106378]